MMLYCDLCANDLNWRRADHREQGTCEKCGHEGDVTRTPFHRLATPRPAQLARVERRKAIYARRKRTAAHG